MGPNKYCNGHNLKNIGRKQKVGYAKTMQSGWEIFTLSSIFHITVDFKKVVSDLFHSGSILAESECIKRKMRGIHPSPYLANVEKPIPFRVKYSLNVIE